MIRTTIAALALAVAAALTSAPAQAAAPQFPTGAQTCNKGQEITYGGTSDRLFRPGGFCLVRVDGGTVRQLVFQGDGNLVLYRDGRATWQSGTAGTAGGYQQYAYLALQGDGNMVIYTSDSYRATARWSSGTGSNNTPTRLLALQSDGNTVIYRFMYGYAAAALWSSGTAGQ